MFSDDDVREIVRLSPPPPASADKENRLDSLSPLLPLASGTGLITLKHALRHFDSIVSSSPDILPVLLLSSSLDLDVDYVVKFVEASPSLAIFNQDRTSVFPKLHRDSLKHQLLKLAADHIVSKTAFAKEHDIENINSLIRLNDDEALEKLHEVDDYIFTTQYQRTIETEVQAQLSKASEDDVPAELLPTILKGTPPLWFLSRTLDLVLGQPGNQGQWHIEQNQGDIQCFPTSSLVRNSDAVIARLSKGDLPYLDCRAFSKEYQSLYPTAKDVEERLSKEPGIDIQSSYGLSQTWLSHFINDCRNTIETNGYLDVNPSVSDVFPTELRSCILDRVNEQLGVTPNQAPDSIGSTGHNLHRIGGLTISSDRYESDVSVLQEATKSCALQGWRQLQEDANKQIVFQVSMIAGSLPTTNSVLDAMMKAPELHKIVEVEFWKTVAELEAQNEADFASYWRERVTVRVRVYTSGLDAVQDAKLRDQLSDLLAGYVQKELVPDSLAKARAQGLVLSRKTQKNIQKLETVSTAGKDDMSGVLKMLDRFSKKQDLPTLDLDPSSVEGGKKALIKDMVRRMQKQSDGPLLFLTLVIVLLAAHNTGVVYATGRFAPKLMKQLNASLDAGQYERLEAWKEGAKTGKLTVEDKAAMKIMAEKSAS